MTRRLANYRRAICRHTLVRLALLATLAPACGSSGRSDGLQISFDADGFADGTVDITVLPSFDPNGLRAGLDGALFVFGHADVGHGEDASTNGRNLVFKLRSDGHRDSAFADDGVYVQLDVRELLQDLAVRPDGSVVILGTANGMPVVWQLDPSGKLDPAFGDQGAAVVDPSAELAAGGTAMAQHLALREDGSILLLGFATPNPQVPPQDNLVARLSATGVVEKHILTPRGTDTWWGVRLAPSGAPLVFGERWDGSQVHPMVERLTADLTPDTTFSPDGVKVATVSSYNREPVTLPDGRFATAGSTGQGQTFHGGLLVFTADGDADVGFDGDGHLELPDWVMGVVGLPGGGLIVQLEGLNTLGPEYAVRLLSNGAIDPAFGDGGRSTGTYEGFGIVMTTTGDVYTAAWRWPDGLQVRQLPTR